MTSAIHPTAIIADGARVPASCRIGPYCILGPEVTLGENCILESHVVIPGPARIGSDNHFWPFSAIAADPQDYTFDPRQKTWLEMGDRNIVRECVTISRGTAKGGGATRLGSDCFLMAYAHLGHDSQVGNHVMLINAATVAGHVTIEDWAVVGALCPVHQFVRIGAHSYIGGGTTITQDVLPYSMTVARRDVATFGVNAVGLERRGFSRDRIRAIERACKLVKRNNISQALEKLRALPESPDLAHLIRFLQSSDRGIIK
jgi:UDP-N-acetylglucosamine acyltransferase